MKEIIVQGGGRLIGMVVQGGFTVITFAVLSIHMYILKYLFFYFFDLKYLFFFSKKNSIVSCIYK